MSTQPVAGIFNFPNPDRGLNVGVRPDAKSIPNNRLGHLFFTFALLLLAVFTSIPCLGKELTPISPSHAKLLEGRKLLIDEGGGVHVQITRAPATPHFPPSGPSHWLFQGPPAESKVLAVLAMMKGRP